MQIIPTSIAKFSLAFGLVFPGIPGHAEAQLFNPETGLRIAHYRAPVNVAPPGIEAIGFDSVEELILKRAVLLDVHPLRVFEILPDGEWIVPKPLESLPGAIWLPVVGWGDIDAWARDYLENSLKEVATSQQTVVVFCRFDCWLSWNAAQRVAALGYETKWFAGGIDEWRDFGGSLEAVLPWPVP